MIIDSHIHLLQSKNFRESNLKSLGLSVPTDTVLEDLMSWMDQANVDKAVVMGQDASRIQDINFGEKKIVQATKRYPSKFIGLASIEPFDQYDKIKKESLDYFERAIIEDDLRGLLLTPPFGHYYSNDKRLYPFYQKAVEFDVPIQFHHSAAPGPPIIAPYKYARISLLNDVSIDFPNLKMIIEHLAYPWTEELFAMMASNPNIYADLALLYDRPTILAWNLVKAKEYQVINKIFYASDYCSRGLIGFSNEPVNEFKKYINYIRVGLNEVAEKAGWPKFSIKEIDGILGGNVARLYNL